MTFLGGNVQNEPTGSPLRANGTAAAPGAGSSFVVSAIPAAGFYSITGGYIITGAVETQPLNVRLGVNGGGFVDLPSGGGVSAYVPFSIPRVLLDGANQVRLISIAAATAATVYTGFVILTPLSS